VDDLMNLSRQDGGNDMLYGQGGHDVLIGAAGEDVLVGGRGDDVMWGGLGQDSFVWEDGDIVPDVPEVDRIEDFVLGSGDDADSLDLSGILSDGAAADISSYLVAISEGDTLVLKVKSDGGIDASGSNADLTIELAGLGGSGSGADVLQQMLDDGQLIVD
ncbi:MAG: type I secretion C-terminal target domain-containing protein, partial [Pseudomonadota bacterium]|nr:type I secretion C-terminal target domain-containing protein [Pseudomonadota bacterium]